eukprot:1139260-Pelagomonas_calceolata.AAC.8
MVWSHNLRTYEFAEVCMLQLCRLQLLSRPRVFTVFQSSAHAANIHSVGVVASRGWLCCCKISNDSGDTGILSAGPGGNPFPQIFWSAKEEKGEHATDTSRAPAPAPKLTYLPSLQNALKSHTHAKYRLGYSTPKTG